MQATREADIDRLAELTNVGAGHAAGAYAQLLGRTVWTRVPEVLADGAESGSGNAFGAGIFFELEGCLDGALAILVPVDMGETLVRRLTGMESGVLPPALFESALMEAGNILASHLASAIADLLQGRLLPSPPTLVQDSVDDELDRWLADRAGPGALRILSDLRDEDGTPCARLVMVPSTSACLRAPEPGAGSSAVGR